MSILKERFVEMFYDRCMLLYYLSPLCTKDGVFRKSDYHSTLLSTTVIDVLSKDSFGSDTNRDFLFILKTPLIFSDIRDRSLKDLCLVPGQ